MSGDNILKRIMDCKPEGRRKIERPKVRGIDEILKDIKKLEINNWWRVARVREDWRKYVQGVDAYGGLYSY
jgi:hypothetical protein